MKDKKSLLIIVLIILILIGATFGFLYFKNNTSNIDCTYSLENSSYNKELSSICKKNDIKYIAYTKKEELGELKLDEYKVAKHFDFKYFDNINDAQASTKKNLILSYLNFDKDTCYAKSIVEEAISTIFTEKNDLKNIFDNSEINDNFICVNNIQTNEVIIDSPYYLLNNKNIVEIWKNDDGSLFVKNKADYSNNDVSDTVVSVNIIQTNIDSLLKKEYFSTNLGNYNIVLNENTKYKFKHPSTELELKDGNVYISDNNTKKTSLAKNIDKVFLHEYEEYDGYTIYLLDKDGNIYKKSDDSYLVYNKIKTDYKFKNIYYIFDDTIVGETNDGKLFDLYDEKIIDYYENDIYVGNDYKNVKYNLKVNLNDYSVLMDDKDSNYKVKYSFGDYLLTTENYLFKVSDGKLISNSKAKEISVENIVIDDVNDIHRLFITFENNEKLILFDVY